MHAARAGRRPSSRLPDAEEIASAVLLRRATLLVVIVDPNSRRTAPTSPHRLTGLRPLQASSFLLVRGEPSPYKHLASYSLVIDVVWIPDQRLHHTEGGYDPFLPLHVSSFQASASAGGFARRCSSRSDPAIAPTPLSSSSRAPRSAATRLPPGSSVPPVYLLTLAYLIGYLGEHEPALEANLGFMLELPAAFRPNRPPAAR